MSSFSDAVLAANKWIEAHPNVSLVYSDASEQRMHFTMASTAQSGGGSFDIQLQTGDRIIWIVKSDCHDQNFLDEAKTLCTKDTNLTLEELLDCINCERKSMSSSDNGWNCKEGSEEEYMATGDYADDNYYKDDSKALKKPPEPLYSEEEFSQFACGRNPSAIKRLLADMKSLNSSKGKFGVVGSPRGDNLFIWDFRLIDFEPKSQLAQDLLTYSKKFRAEAAISLEMKFQDTYPMTPPFVRVTGPHFKFLSSHMTIGGSSGVEALMRSCWSPGNDIEGILIQIRSEIMNDPNAHLELNRNHEYTEVEAQDFVTEMMDSEGHGSIVFELEDILFHILSNLSTKELDLIARVNSTWHQVTMRIKQKRIEQTRKRIVWSYYDALESGGVDKNIGLVLENLPAEPHFALVFVSSNLEDKISIPVSTGTKREEIAFSNYLERSLPSSSCIAGVVSVRVIGNTFSPSHAVQFEDGPTASCLFLPKLREVDIYHFRMGENSEKQEKSFSAETGIPKDKFPKLILLFHRYFEDCSVKKFGSKILKNYRGVIIAGGSANGMDLFTDAAFKLQNQNKYSAYAPLLLGVAFCAEYGLHIASVVVRKNKNNKKSVEAELSRLKTVHVPEKCSVAFLFCNMTY